MKYLSFFFLALLIISCESDLKSISTFNDFPLKTENKRPIKVEMEIKGKDFYHLMKGYYDSTLKSKAIKDDSIPVLLVDISVHNLSNDSSSLIFLYTGYASQLLFDPSYLKTFGFCCDKNSLENMLFPPKGKIVFHTMINDLSNRGILTRENIRVGFVVVDSSNQMYDEYLHDLAEKKKSGNEVYWSDEVNIQQNFPISYQYNKYDYGFSVIDSTGTLLYTSRPTTGEE